MRCPACNYVESKVIDSRATEDNSTIRRRRECHQCGTRFTTFEMGEKVPLMVRKKDGRRVVFDDYESLNFFQKMLRQRGVIAALRKAGAKDGDTVVIGDIEFEFVD